MTTIAADSLKLPPPVLRQTREGLVAGLSIDRVLVDGAFLGVSGWAIA